MRKMYSKKQIESMAKEQAESVVNDTSSTGLLYESVASINNNMCEEATDGDLTSFEDMAQKVVENSEKLANDVSLTRDENGVLHLTFNPKTWPVLFECTDGTHTITIKRNNLQSFSFEVDGNDEGIEVDSASSDEGYMDFTDGEGYFDTGITFSNLILVYDFVSGIGVEI